MSDGLFALVRPRVGFSDGSWREASVTRDEDASFLSWERWRGAFGGNNGQSLKSAGRLELELPERELGSGCPAYAASKIGIPEELRLLITHTFATTRVIELLCASIFCRPIPDCEGS
jgi:hypothetical protein